MKTTTHGGKRAGAGRKPEPDPAKPLPFRLKASTIVKAKALGRERLEHLIELASLAPFPDDQQAFDRWWHQEGSAMRPLPKEDAEAHVHRISQIAWSNGAFIARQKT